MTKENLFHDGKWYKSPKETSTENDRGKLSKSVEHFVVDRMWQKKMVCRLESKLDTLNLLVDSKKLYSSPETSLSLPAFFESNQVSVTFSWVENHGPNLQYRTSEPLGLPVKARATKQKMAECQIAFGGRTHTSQMVTVELGNEVTLIPSSKFENFGIILKEHVHDSTLEQGRYQGDCEPLVKFIKGVHSVFYDPLSMSIYHLEFSLHLMSAQLFERKGNTCTLLIEDSMKEDNEWILDLLF